jgi:colicin import membrane protein
MSTTKVRQTCRYPGCGQARRPSGRDRTAAGVLRRARPHAGQRVAGTAPASRRAGRTTISPAEDGSPLTTAKVTGAELLRSLRPEAERITVWGPSYGTGSTLSPARPPPGPKSRPFAPPPNNASLPPKSALQPPGSSATAEQLRTEADAAPDEMNEHLTAAQGLAQAASERAAAAEQERDAAVAQARAEADEQVAAGGAEQEAAIAQARAEAGQRVRAADSERDQARQAAADTEADARQAEQEAAHAQAAARAETERVRADAEKAIGELCAAAARERDELRARAERAEQQADAYRDEPAQLRAGSSADDTGNGDGPAPVKTTRRVAHTQAT